MIEKISLQQRVSLWISLFIPGFITALVDFDISIFAAYAVTASVLGIHSIWLLAVVYAIVHVLNSISGKVVIVSEKGLIELIREHFGIPVSLAVFLFMFALDVLVIAQSILALKFIAGLLNIRFLLFSSVFILYLLLVFILKIQKFTNRIFIIIAVFYFSVILYLFGNMPVMIEHLSSFFLKFPDFFQYDYSLFFLAMLGSTASAWNQLLISRYTYKTKLNLDKLEYHILDNRTTTLTTFVFGAFFLTVFSFLFPNGSLLTDPAVSVAGFIPIFQPELRMYFFSLGFLLIALTNMYAVTLSFSHVYTEFFGIERSDESGHKFTRTNYLLFFALIIPGMIIASATKLELFQSAIAFGLLQFPHIFALMYFLYFFANHKSTMGRYTNDWIHNALLLSMAAFLFSLFLRVIAQILFKI